MNLFPDQQHALELAKEARIFILTGSAGTGKSTAVKAILQELAKPGFRFALAAPSGKAAKRLSEVTGYQASTIHRLLEPTRVEDRFVFTRGPRNPLEADLIVLDEVSMVDVSLMARFLEAVRSDTKLIFVGDPYQLASVGPGNVLKDLLDSQVFPIAELTVIKRQDPGLLLQNCHRIKDGQDIEVDNNEANDFFFFSRMEEAGVQDKIVDLATRSLPEAKNLDPLRDIQVISPFRERTELSCKALNARLQGVLNHNPIVDGCRFRVGDKVIQQKNDYTAEIMNGDIGYVKEISKERKKITVLFENPDRLVELGLYENDLELAYCLTIHKSQGSEWPVVIIPIHKSFGGLLMNRNLFYTAVSRARDLCFMIGHRGEVSKVVRRSELGRRYTNLTHMLNGKK